MFLFKYCIGEIACHENFHLHQSYPSWISNPCVQYSTGTATRLTGTDLKLILPLYKYNAGTEGRLNSLQYNTLLVLTELIALQYSTAWY